MKYSVKTLREAGLQARWTKTGKYQSKPIIVARDPKAPHAHQRDTWWAVDDRMWSAMCRDGIRSGFLSVTFLGDLFSIPI